jgi:alkylation response protein AidB-like acyl-CoA dehydrogenase
MVSGSIDLTSIVQECGPLFASRAEASDAEDRFVTTNFEELKARGVMAAGVSSELGGGGASYREVCEFLRELGKACSSTALTLSMHMHQVMIPVWRWRNEGGAGEPLLRRIAAENLMIVTSGGSDWLESSGTLEKVDGGYRFSARKVFASGSPAGDIFMTTGIYEDPTEGPTVLHFPLPLTAEGVKVQDNWRTMGMRGTGSNDIVIEGAFIPDAAIGLRRPKGTWGIFHLVAMVALPLVYSVYAGIAQRARDIAIERATRRRDDADVRLNVGEMENQLRATQIALEDAIRIAEVSQPGPATTNEVLIRRTLCGEAAIATVGKAMEVAGGGAFYRSLGLERLFRDVQAARFHPLQEKRQLEFTARYTLGLPIE